MKSLKEVADGCLRGVVREKVELSVIRLFQIFADGEILDVPAGHGYWQAGRIVSLTREDGSGKSYILKMQADDGRMFSHYIRCK